MDYDLHIVRTRNWLDAARAPITKEDADVVVVADPELEWLPSGVVAVPGLVWPDFIICWRGAPCFWWHRDQISCKDPNEAQKKKMIEIARVLSAYVVGDEDEIYDLRKSIFGRETVIFSR